MSQIEPSRADTSRGEKRSVFIKQNLTKDYRIVWDPVLFSKSEELILIVININMIKSKISKADLRRSNQPQTGVFPISI